MGSTIRERERGVTKSGYFKRIAISTDPLLLIKSQKYLPNHFNRINYLISLGLLMMLDYKSIEFGLLHYALIHYIWASLF